MCDCLSTLEAQRLSAWVKSAHNRLLWFSLWTPISASVLPLPAGASQDLRLRLHESQQGVGYTRRPRIVGKHVKSGSLLFLVDGGCFQVRRGPMVSTESAEHAWLSPTLLVPVLKRQAAVIVGRTHADARTTQRGCTAASSAQIGPGCMGMHYSAYGHSYCTKRMLEVPLCPKTPDIESP